MINVRYPWKMHGIQQNVVLTLLMDVIMRTILRVLLHRCVWEGYNCDWIGPGIVRIAKEVKQRPVHQESQT